MHSVTEVAVLVPVLGRPRAAQPLVESFVNSIPAGLARLVFICSHGDTDETNACVATGCRTLMLDQQPGPGDFARKIQKGFEQTDEPFVFQAADDVAFQPGWCRAVLAAIEDGDQYGVCGTWDGANPQVMRGVHSTHSLIRRAYIDECGGSWDGPGTVFSQAYSHQWVDVELIELAKLRGCFTFAKASRVLHRHPLFDRKVARDSIYERGFADAAADRALFHARQREWLRELAVA